MTGKTATTDRGEKFFVLRVTDNYVMVRHIRTDWIYEVYPRLNNKMFDGGTGEAFEGFGRFTQETLLSLLNH